MSRSELSGFGIVRDCDGVPGGGGDDLQASARLDIGLIELA